jgi:antitoxin (DNA-binding transcriptional repressor) of toxin-antitoxin stability system
MKSVGIKALKNELSRYIGLVREGETVYVTDRGHVVAEIRRPRRAKPVSRWDEFLEGQIRAGRVKSPQPRYSIISVIEGLPPLPGGVDLLRTLDDLREDRV